MTTTEQLIEQFLDTHVICTNHETASKELYRILAQFGKEVTEQVLIDNA